MPPEHEYYVHTPDPFLYKFPWGEWGIRYYGLAYVLGFVAGALLLHLYWKRRRSPLDPNMQADLLFYVILGTLVGGRLGYFLFYAPGDLLHNPLILFRVWDGGMASHGGFIGVFLGLWWTARKHRLPLTRVGDIVVTLAPPGLMLGRLANFINGELWGKPTDVPWAVVFTNCADYNVPVVPRHPSQLYEAALEGLLLLLWTQARIWRTPRVLERPGRLAGEFLLGYGLVRIFCEQFREPDIGIEPVLGINRGGWLSMALVAVGACLIVRSILHARGAPPASPQTKPPR